MNIGAASKASGVTAKMIRYYESIGLLPQADRRESGYRDYGPDDVQRLAFVKRARDLAFSMEQIAELLSLWSDKGRSRAEVRDVATRHIEEMKAQALRLQEMIGTLQGLVTACAHGSNRPDCPIIASLETGITLKKTNGKDRCG